jgi:tryptophan-rich sensory protein
MTSWLVVVVFALVLLCGLAGWWATRRDRSWQGRRPDWDPPRRIPGQRGRSE